MLTNGDLFLALNEKNSEPCEDWSTRLCVH